MSDILTIDMSAFPASTCAGDPAEIVALVRDPSVKRWARWVACDALVPLVVQGDLVADELVNTLMDAAVEQSRDPDNFSWSIVANAQHDLAHPCPCGSGKKYKKCHLELDASASR